MESVLIKTSQNNSTWVDLPIASRYSISYEDLDDDSFRSKLTGNLIRRRISPRWIKIGLEYNCVTDAELDSIAKQVNTNQKFYVRVKAPAFGNMNSAGSTSATDKTWVTFRAYVSNYQAEMLPLQKGWTLNFNIIQSDTGTFQS